MAADRDNDFFERERVREREEREERDRSRGRNVAHRARTYRVPGSPGSAEDGTQTSRPGGIKVRLTLGPALIDLEATLEEIVVVVTRLTQEFTKAAIITSD